MRNRLAPISLILRQIRSDDYYVTGIKRINVGVPADAHYETKRVARIVKGDVPSTFYEPTYSRYVVIRFLLSFCDLPIATIDNEDKYKTFSMNISYLNDDVRRRGFKNSPKRKLSKRYNKVADSKPMYVNADHADQNADVSVRKHFFCSNNAK